MPLWESLSEAEGVDHTEVAGMDKAAGRVAVDKAAGDRAAAGKAVDKVVAGKVAHKVAVQLQRQKKR